jgi:hypothetical protein
MLGYSPSQDLAKARTLLGGTWGPPRDPACLLGSSGLVRTGVWCPFVEVQTQRYILGCIIFPCHMVSFSVWPGDAVRVQRLHTVEEGTPNLGYRQWPPSPPQGRMRACRWGQSLISSWPALLRVC